MTLCNMAVEAGAKTGIFEADEKAMEYLKEHGREPKAVFHSDQDAKYVREYTFDLSKVRPVVARPDFVDNVVPAEETCGIEINEAFLGSCMSKSDIRPPEVCDCNFSNMLGLIPGSTTNEPKR